MIYDKFFKIDRAFNVFIKLYIISDIRTKTGDYDTKTDTYNVQIPNKYAGGEYPNGYINKSYLILKIFNKSNVESRAKYYFKKDEKYLSEIRIPARGQLILRKRK